MALSSYFNLDTLHQEKQEAELPNHEQLLLNYSNDFGLIHDPITTSFFDSSFYFDDLNNINHNDIFLYPEIYPSIFPFPSSSQYCDQTSFFPTQLDNIVYYDPIPLAPYPKRQKCLQDNQQQYLSTMPEFKVPNTVVVEVENSKKNDHHENFKSVSVQSVAARERRRKITEKTQELGKLVPGGNKMNTAEMLHAASKYVKYLQAQLGILQLMGTLEDQESKASTPPKDLQVLLASPNVQERLYLEEKCFVPKDFVAVLANHHDVQSKPSIHDDLNQLIRSDG
ncbi:Transcription factor [Quillaja saponaria]|uniref:Transcription factor n=1 Tax=Quillaja saponaria TaxID=32244 RepID=A0AAD7QID9_QUISA|nr:Transcription factor [Quillaja saponaria]